jgi:hypothetical protein
MFQAPDSPGVDMPTSKVTTCLLKPTAITMSLLLGIGASSGISSDVLNTDIQHEEILRAAIQQRCSTGDSHIQPPPVDLDCGSMQVHLLATYEPEDNISEQFDLTRIA